MCQFYYQNFNLLDLQGTIFYPFIWSYNGQNKLNFLLEIRYKICIIFKDLKEAGRYNCILNNKG